MCGFTSASGSVPTCGASWCSGPTAPAKRGTTSNPTASSSSGKARADPDSQLAAGSLSVPRDDYSELPYTAAAYRSLRVQPSRRKVSMIARTRRRTVWLVCLGVLVLMALVPRDTTAQVLYGSVVGDVKDATGGALPGATLVITSTDRGLTREAVTDAGGHFTFSNLPAGVYGLKAHGTASSGSRIRRADKACGETARLTPAPSRSPRSPGAGAGGAPRRRSGARSDRRRPSRRC